jgi:nudix-type nucleoside diphosphatase (YffH/AdpP family)
VESVRLLSDSWYILKSTTFAFLRSDGSWQTQSRETYDRGNGAVILLFDPDRRTVILIRQFRYPAFVNGCDDLLIEAPAGLLDDADPESRIRAEVEEETGYSVRDVTRIFEAYMSPGAVTEKLHFFIGRYTPGDRTSAGGGSLSSTGQLCASTGGPSSLGLRDGSCRWIVLAASAATTQRPCSRSPW